MTAKIADILNSILSKYHDDYDLEIVPISVVRLRSIIEAEGVVDHIIWEKVNLATKYIAAQVQFFESGVGVYKDKGSYARIQIANNLNYCWTSFAICKEMFHCIIDVEKKDRVTTVDDLLKLCEHLVAGTSAAIEPFPAYDTETIAELLALETLMPMELRSSQKAAYENGEITSFELATRYCIPEEYAQMAMYPSYFGNMLKLRKKSLIVM